MSVLLDDAAMRVRAQLAADAHIAGLRRLSRKPLRVRFELVVVLLAVLAAFGGVAVAGAALAATSCVSEDSNHARIGTDRFGCVWWAQTQGNGRGRTVWNR